MYDESMHDMISGLTHRHIRGIQQVDPSAARSIEGMTVINAPHDEYADAQMIECM
jgi:hypothetical protein